VRVLVAAHPYVGHPRIPLQLATYLAGEGHTVAIVTGTGHEAVRALVPWDFPTFAVDGGIDPAAFAGVVPPGVARGTWGPWRRSWSGRGLSPCCATSSR
jgi:hypothetical protein